MTVLTQCVCCAMINDSYPVPVPLSLSFAKGTYVRTFCLETKLAIVLMILSAPEMMYDSCIFGHFYFSTDDVDEIRTPSPTPIHLSVSPPCFELLLPFSPSIRFISLPFFSFLILSIFSHTLLLLLFILPSSLSLSPSYPTPSFSYSLSSSHRLSAFADEVQGLDQYAIRKFGEAFDVVPRTLAENSGGDPTTSMHTLHGSHIASGTGNNLSHFFSF